MRREVYCLIPVSYFAVITWLSVLPAASMPVFNVWDKLQHFGAYFLLMALTAPLCKTKAALGYTGLALAAYGGALEFLQMLSPGRYASWSDALANSLGVAIAALIASAVQQRWIDQHPAR